MSFQATKYICVPCDDGPYLENQETLKKKSLNVQSAERFCPDTGVIRLVPPDPWTDLYVYHRKTGTKQKQWE